MSIREKPAVPVESGGGNGSLLTAMRDLRRREQGRLHAELQQVPGLFALLMKSRNGARWSTEERTALRVQLRGLSHLGLYATFLAVPGTSLVLPLLAWWLDRRTRQRESAVAPSARGERSFGNGRRPPE
ncbi:MAG: hypothetical protein AAB068_06305 [Pseudomonadota bacterium]